MDPDCYGPSTCPDCGENLHVVTNSEELRALTQEKISCACLHDKSLHEHGFGKCIVPKCLCTKYFKMVTRLPPTKS